VRETRRRRKEIRKRGRGRREEEEEVKEQRRGRGEEAEKKIRTTGTQCANHVIGLRSRIYYNNEYNTLCRYYILLCYILLLLLLYPTTGPAVFDRTKHDNVRPYCVAAALVTLHMRRYICIRNETTPFRLYNNTSPRTHNDDDDSARFRSPSRAAVRNRF
jgi:hypothetical protein